MFSQADLTAAAQKLDCEVEAIMAVNAVETPRGAFDERRRPTALFEPHVFWRSLLKIGYTPEQLGELAEKHKADKILSPSWNPALYGTYRVQWDKIGVAATIDKECAYKAASFGAFQILGESCRDAGYATAVQMATSFAMSEGMQLSGFVKYAETKHLGEKLKAHDWAGFARTFNGPAYAKDHYDVRLRAAYDQFVKMRELQEGLANDKQVLV